MKRLFVLFYSFSALLNACSNSPQLQNLVDEVSDEISSISYCYYDSGAEWVQNSDDVEFELVETYETEEYLIEKSESIEKDITSFSIIKTNAIFLYTTVSHTGIPECDSLVHIKDINFDNKDDVCISTGNRGDATEVFYLAYLSNGDGTYTFCNGFENVANPVVDEKNKCILSQTFDGMTTYKYVYEGNAITLQKQ